MSTIPTFDDIFRVLSVSSAGETNARVALRDEPDLSVERTRLSIALNLLLDDLALRAEDERGLMAALRASEERYRLLFDSNPTPMWVFDVETLAFLAVNDSAVQHYGYSRQEFFAMTIKDIRPAEEIATLAEDLVDAPRMKTQKTWRHRKKDGKVIAVEIATHSFAFEGRSARLVLAHDVTERHKLEEQLRQAQKMEAIGQLAGGVAHDFNNLLSVILSYCSTLTDELRPGEPMRDDIEEIRRAGEKAAALTRQLLAFSRQQIVEPKVLNLSKVVDDVEKMLRRVIGAHIDLATVAGPSLGSVKADRGQLEQVLMNLVVNARDAMPQGGKLLIETSNVELDENYARQHVGVNPGAYVTLAVSDTGSGMDEATQSRIFEPFFTTKPKGKGTGLGLSTVFGIVKQNGGHIWPYSEVGVGTVFKIYLPRVDQAATNTQEQVRSPHVSLRGSETILLVEDEDQVRVLVRGLLKKSGYNVLEARNAGEALLTCEGHAGRIDLLLTDVVMPQMSGTQLAKRLAATRPGMRIVCMSGYTDDAVLNSGLVDSGMAFLQKPITPEALGRKLREALDN
jgi:two-component system cell cycle sensor histidine kinase/response regulator CckA